LDDDGVWSQERSLSLQGLDASIAVRPAQTREYVLVAAKYHARRRAVEPLAAGVAGVAWFEVCEALDAAGKGRVAA